MLAHTAAGIKRSVEIHIICCLLIEFCLPLNENDRQFNYLKA